jgi:hypothetical protein
VATVLFKFAQLQFGNNGYGWFWYFAKQPRGLHKHHDKWCAIQSAILQCVSKGNTMSFFDLGLGLSDAATGGLISAGGSLLGGLLGSSASGNAASEQAGASRYAADLQKQMFDTQNAQQAPYREAGYTALNDIGGLKSYLQKQFTPQDFSAGIDPGYAFRLQQGQEATNRMANMGGGVLSGNALKGQEDYTQGLASQEYGNAFNRFQTQRNNIFNTLASIAGLGQTSLGQTTNASTTAAGNIGSNIANAGAATAGGIVGSANALTGGLQNAGNQYYLSQLLAPKSGVNYSLGGGYTPSGQPSISQPNPDMGGGQGIQIRI